MVDKAVSPIKCTDSFTFAKSANDQTTNSISHNDEIAKRDLLHEDNNDWEIELILNNMRLEHSLITPMPSSPSRLSDIESRSLSTIFESCEDAKVAKLQDDNKKLQSNMVLIKKEMLKLKRFIQSMDLDDEFNRFMDVSLINDMDTAALKTVQMDLQSPVQSIDNDDTITIDLHDYDDHATGVIPPVNNNDVLLVEPDKTQLEKLIGEQDSLNVEGTENDQVSSCKDCEASKKMTKARKLSKLDKLRKRMLPKSKIRRFVGPPERLLRSMTKRLSPYNSSSPVLSKQQEAYAKAVLVWKQLNSKKKVTHKKDNARPKITNKTKKPNEDENKTESKNELSLNKFDNKLKNNSQLQTVTNKSRKISETTSAKESYGIKTRKSSISLPDCPLADHKNINCVVSDKALFVVLELSLNEKVQMLQKEHANILNTVNNTVKSPRGTKSPNVNLAAESETRSKRILRRSSTTERNEDDANKSKTDSVVLRSDIESPSRNEPENLKTQTRRSLRASPKSRKNSHEEVISNNKEELNDNATSREHRGRGKPVNKTPIQYKRILRSSNQLPDSPNSPESQELRTSVRDTDAKEHAVFSQRQGYQSTSTDNTSVCSGTNSLRSSIQQSDKIAPPEDCDKIDIDTSPLKRKGRKRKCQDISVIQSKRSLRSSVVVQSCAVNNCVKATPSSATCNEMLHEDNPKSIINDKIKRNLHNRQKSNAKNNVDNTAYNKYFNDSTETNVTTNEKDPLILLSCLENLSNKHSNQVTCHEATEELKKSDNSKQIHENDTCVSHTSIGDNWKNSVLCKGIEKYGFNNDKNSMKKLPGIDFFKCLLFLSFLLLRI